MFPTPQQQQQPFTPNPQVFDPTFTQTFPAQTQQFTPSASASQPFMQSQPYQQFPTQQQFATPQAVNTPQQFNPPQQPIMPEWTGAGFGGYTPSSAGSPVTILPTIPSGSPTQPQFSPSVTNTGLQVDRNTTGTNPFRASMMSAPSNAQSFSPDPSTGQSSKSTNPFATGSRKQTMSPTLSQPQSFSSQSSYPSISQQSPFPQTFTPQIQPAQQPQSQPSVFQPSQPQATFAQSPPQTQSAFLQSSSTGTNPFSRSQPQVQQPRLTPQVTGSNPFRQSVLPQSGTASGTASSTGLSNGYGWNPQP